MKETTTKMLNPIEPYIQDIQISIYNETLLNCYVKLNESPYLFFILVTVSVKKN